jgi:hypothetical protein
MLQVTAAGSHASLGSRARRLVPSPVRRVAARFVSERRAAAVQRELEALAGGHEPIMVGPWLGEVGFELLYWVPFLRWFAHEYRVPADRIVAVARGGSASAWYASFAGRTYDALSFLPPQDFKRRNLARSGSMGEQKQIASTPLDEEIIGFVRKSEGHDVKVLHPSTMYKLYSPYWWGHQPLAWVRNYMRFERLRAPALGVALPSSYTAVKFYFNDCFADTPRNRAFVERAIHDLATDGPVISLSTGLAIDDHDACEPDIAAMQGIRHLLTPDTNLLVQSAVVAGARRFVGTYGGFAYLAPLCGVPASSYYSEPGSFSLRHLDLMRDVLRTENSPHLLEVAEVRRESGR